MLAVSHLSFSYHRAAGPCVPILKDISFTLEPGQCLVVLGANGCGKSTLLSLLSGALHGAKGTIRTDGESFGLVPQGFSVFDDLTVLENLRFFAGLAHTKVERPLPFGLEPYASRRSGILSGGYQKRLCIACTAVSHPDIWLFDEPCASLDIVFRDEMIRMVCDLRRSGHAVLYVGHDPAEFAPFYDGLLFLKDGAGTLIPRDRIPEGGEEALIRRMIREAPRTT